MAAIVWNKRASLPGPPEDDNAAHVRRVQDELRDAGATMYGLAKFSSQYLYRLVHPDEHIRGAVYGRYKGGRGILGFTEGMLVATDRRIVFLDYKPGFTSVEEIAYRAVSGIDYVVAGPFSSVTLHTRIGSFTIRYANATCIHTFVSYIGTRQIEEPEPAQSAAATTQPIATPKEFFIKNDTRTFLDHHNVAVLSTVSKNGTVHGAAVHYLLDASGAVYLITKASTLKAQNMVATHQAALTIYDAPRLQTVQIHGYATVEDRQDIQEWVFGALYPQQSAPQGASADNAALLREGHFAVFRITPDTVRFIDFALKGQELAEAAQSVAGDMPEA